MFIWSVECFVSVHVWYRINMLLCIIVTFNVLQVTLDDEVVKSEPLDVDEDSLHKGDNQDNKDTLHQELGFDATDSMGGDEDNFVDVDPSMLGGQPQNMDDVAQAIPGSSGFQGVSFFCHIIMFISFYTIYFVLSYSSITHQIYIHFL